MPTLRFRRDSTLLAESICRRTINSYVWFSKLPIWEIIISAGIRYSNMEPDHEMRAKPRPTGVSARPRRNQWEDETSPLAMAMSPCQARLRSQQVVTVDVQLVVGDAVADGKFLTRAIKKKAEIHRLHHVVSLVRNSREAANERDCILR